jgi:flagellin
LGNALAAISYMYDRRGRMVNEVLHLNMSQFVPDSSPNGTNQHIIQNDRIIAHEITHAIMGRNMDWRNLPEWFKEGTAEYIAGAGERAHLALAYLSPQQLVSQAAADWQGDSPQYAGAYLAVRFLDVITANGGGLKAIMGRLKAGDSLDTAIAQVSEGAFPSTESFLRQWEKQGVAFLRSLDLSGKDPGAIGQAKGPDVVPDVGRKANQPMQGFRIIWPSPLEGSLLFGQAPAVADAYQRLMPNRPQRPLGEWI